MMSNTEWVQINADSQTFRYILSCIISFHVIYHFMLVARGMVQRSQKDEEKFRIEQETDKHTCELCLLFSFSFQKLWCYLHVYYKSMLYALRYFSIGTLYLIGDSF